MPTVPKGGDRKKRRRPWGWWVLIAIVASILWGNLFDEDGGHVAQTTPTQAVVGGRRG